MKAYNDIVRRIETLEKKALLINRPKLEFFPDRFFTCGGKDFVGYKLRSYQKRDIIDFKTMDQPKMYLMYARRSGKDSFCWPLTIDRALEVPGNYAYMLPDKEQAKKVIWRGAMIDKKTKKTNRFMDMIPRTELLKKNEVDNIIYLKNGSIIYLVGANRPDSLRGINLSGIVFSEFAFFNSYEAYHIISPVITESKAWVLINTTPKSVDYSWKLFEQHSKNDRWITRIETVETLVDENGERYITDQDVQDAREDTNMPEWKVEREFYCKPSQDDTTVYYSLEMKDMRETNRIRDLVPDIKLPVHFSFDLGSDGTPVIGFQLSSTGAIRIIYFLEPTTEVRTWNYYWNQINLFVNKNNLMMGKVILPHDSAKRQVSAHAVTSAYDDFVSFGANVIKLKRPSDKDSLINLSKKHFSKVFIDHKCTYLINALDSYNRKYDEKTMTYAPKPTHDWASHPADAFQYMMMAIETGQLSQKTMRPFYRAGINHDPKTDGSYDNVFPIDNSDKLNKDALDEIYSQDDIYVKKY